MLAASLAGFEQLGNRHGLARTLVDLGECHLLAGRHVDALGALRRAPAEFERQGNGLWRARALVVLGRCQAARGAASAARTAYRKALELFGHLHISQRTDVEMLLLALDSRSPAE